MDVGVCAAKKTKQVAEYLSLHGRGEGSRGDVRTTCLQQGELHWVCPPIGFITEVLLRLEEERVAAIVVVPHWTAKEWHLWIRQRAEDMELLPWNDVYPATWLDTADAKAKPHRVANKWQFTIAAIDFRKGAKKPAQPQKALPRYWDNGSSDQKWWRFNQLETQWARQLKKGGPGYQRKQNKTLSLGSELPDSLKSQSGKLERPKLPVLSLGDGIGTVANAAQCVTNWLKESFSR